MDKKMILRDSPEAASIKTVTGWVSSGGRFWGDDERMARFDGATHQRCEKNPDHPIYSLRSYCEACRKEADAAKFAAMPSIEWDEEVPIVIFGTDIYFFDVDSLFDYLVDNEIDPDNAPLVVCEPNMAREIDGDEHFVDDLPEDGEISSTLRAAIDALNAVIRAEPPLSWSQGDTAATLSPSLVAEIRAAQQSGQGAGR